jgi:hypothetical protein
MFAYAVERCIRFPPQNSSAEAIVVYTQAVAVFIEALGIGLTNAKAAQENKERNRNAASLCWSVPWQDLELLASPIPHAKPSAHGLAITQGELYRFRGVNKPIGDWIKGFERWDVLAFDGSPSTVEHCIIKIS